jgi:hypothetical protein
MLENPLSPTPLDGMTALSSLAALRGTLDLSRGASDVQLGRVARDAIPLACLFHGDAGRSPANGVRAIVERYNRLIALDGRSAGVRETSTLYQDAVARDVSRAGVIVDAPPAYALNLDLLPDFADTSDEPEAVAGAGDLLQALMGLPANVGAVVVTNLGDREDSLHG